MAAAKPPPGGAVGGGASATLGARPEGVLSVSDLAALIDGALKDKLPSTLRVVGEVSGFNDRTHWYFTLKDEEAVISAVMFASAAAKCRFRVGNGQRVVASGRVEFFGKQGRTQFYVTSLEPVGLGELELRLRALIEELRGLGWLDAARKRPLPKFPRRVAVVTSKTGAALQDVLDTMRRRCPAVEVVVCDVRVQGPGSGEEVAAMIRRLSRDAAAMGLDALIVTRGGGSIEDLWAFNERVVAEAVLKCSVPVVAAIGHETDTTLVELVADERAATPTQAAMRLTPDTAALLEQLGQLRARAASVISRLVRSEARRLDAAARHPTLSEPLSILRTPKQRLALAAQRLRHSATARMGARRSSIERLSARLARHEPQGLYAARRAAVEHALVRLRRALRARLDPLFLDQSSERLRSAWEIASDRRAAALAALERELAVVGPMSVLARGYSITTRAEDGSVVRSVSGVNDGDRLITRLADGEVRSVTQGGDAAARPLSEKPSPIMPAPLPARRPAKRSAPRRGKHDSPDQMGLF
jgi:exodeoxyribonuclease VII large subunit